MRRLPILAPLLLVFTMAAGAQTQPSPAKPPGVVLPDRGPATAASIFTALEEQLGLTLAPSRGTGAALIIDSIERPSED